MDHIEIATRLEKSRNASCEVLERNHQLMPGDGAFVVVADARLSCHLEIRWIGHDATDLFDFQVLEIAMDDAKSACESVEFDITSRKVGESLLNFDTDDVGLCLFTERKHNRTGTRSQIEYCFCFGGNSREPRKQNRIEVEGLVPIL